MFRAPQLRKVKLILILSLAIVFTLYSYIDVIVQYGKSGLGYPVVTTTTIPPLTDKSKWTSILECPLTEIDPWEPDDSRYFGSPSEPSKCHPKEPVTSKLENGKLWIDPKGYNVNCSYKCLHSKRGNVSKPDTRISFILPGPAQVFCDWVDVSCKIKGWFWNSHYRQVHSQIYVPPESSRPNVTKKRYNVYILGLDSISNGQFHRTMPKTAFYILNKLRGISFQYLSKVGYNSAPNQLAALFGQRFTSVPHPPRGYPILNVTNREFCKKFHTKDEPFLHFIFNDQGYRTVHIEDLKSVITAYPNCKGFRGKFSNHSAVPLFEELEDDDFSKGVLEDSCKEKFQICADFLRNYMKTETPEPKFAYSMLTGPGHEDLEDPYNYDEYFYRWLQSVKENLDDAFLLIWSDHGHHFGKFTNTFRGQTDTRNAMLTVVLPKDLRENSSHPIVQNLRQNSQTLVSQYDMFPTLVDLATADFGSPSSFTKHLTLQDFQKLNKRIHEVHGDSLLRPLTHRTPTCAGLGIPFTFCLCQWPIFTPDDAYELKTRVVYDIPPLLNGFLKSRGAEKKCMHIEIDVDRGIDVAEVSARLVTPSTRMIRTRFNIKGHDYDNSHDTELFFEIATDGSLSLAGRVFRFDTQWTDGKCLTDEYEQYFCICV
uniref:Sulfatase domain-containing protein n=1 Tax=Panagrellus redivivus TaxID=6233 RepID=A0A7E4UYL3_PANRE